jgi:hypothetical protein
MLRYRVRRQAIGVILRLVWSDPGQSGEIHIWVPNREVMTGVAAFPLDYYAMTAPTRASSAPYGAMKGVVDMRSSASRARRRRLRPVLITRI